MYGPRDRDVLKMMKAIKTLKMMPVFGGTFSTVYVRDAARAALLAAESAAASASVYFVSDGGCYTYDHVADIIDRALGITTGAASDTGVAGPGRGLGRARA